MVNFEHVIAGWAISPILGKFEVIQIFFAL